MPVQAAPPRLQLFGPDEKHGARPRAGFKDYVWYVCYREGGKPKERSTGARHSEREKAERFLSQFLRGAPQESGADLLVATAIQQYLDEKPIDPDASPKSDKQLRAWLDRYGVARELLSAHFLGEPVSAVSRERCREYYAARAAADISHNTIYRELSLLRASIRWASSTGRLPAVPTIWVPKPRKKERPVLKRSDIARLLRALRREPFAAHLIPFVMITLYTGHRREAVLTLRFERHDAGGYVDLERGIIDFRRGDGITTNKRRALIPIPRRLLPVLLTTRRRSRAGWVVEEHGRPVRDIKNGLASAMRNAGIPAGRKRGGFSAHDLCHAAVTWRLDRGQPVWKVGGITGRSEKMIRDVYGHMLPETLKELDD